MGIQIKLCHYFVEEAQEQSFGINYCYPFHFPEAISYITLALIVVIYEMEQKKGIEMCTYRRHICSQFSTSHNEVLKPVTVGQSQTHAENIAINSIKE